MLVWHPSSLRLIISFSFTGSDPLKVSELGSPVVNSAYSIAGKRIDSQKLICAPCLVLRRLVAVAMPRTARDKMLMVLMLYSVISVYIDCIYERNNNHCKRFVNPDHLLMFPWHSRRERGSDLPARDRLPGRSFPMKVSIPL
jgi:hypothetical protein